MALVVSNNWFYLKTVQLRVGVSSSAYTSAGEGRIGRSGFMRNPDPNIFLTIPGAATNIRQEINTGAKLQGFIEIPDWAVVKDLFYTIDVVAGGGTETAIETNNSRSVIGYFVLVGAPIQITAADARTTPNAAYSFTNAVIGEVPYLMETRNNPVVITFTADSVTETVA
jgi:hypothetical protein